MGKPLLLSFWQLFLTIQLPLIFKSFEFQNTVIIAFSGDSVNARICRRSVLYSYRNFFNDFYDKMV